jgi:hypothetical protein
MTSRRFDAELRPSGRGGGHLIEVPPEVVDALGGKGRIPVRATFNGVPYRGSIVTMGGAHVLGVTKAIMAEAGVAAGADGPPGRARCSGRPPPGMGRALLHPPTGSRAERDGG